MLLLHDPRARLTLDASLDSHTEMRDDDEAGGQGRSHGDQSSGGVYRLARLAFSPRVLMRLRCRQGVRGRESSGHRDESWVKASSGGARAIIDSLSSVWCEYHYNSTSNTLSFQVSMTEAPKPYNLSASFARERVRVNMVSRLNVPTLQIVHSHYLNSSDLTDHAMSSSHCIAGLGPPHIEGARAPRAFTCPPARDAQLVVVSHPLSTPHTTYRYSTARTRRQRVMSLVSYKSSPAANKDEDRAHNLVHGDKPLPLLPMTYSYLCNQGTHQQPSRQFAIL